MENNEKEDNIVTSSDKGKATATVHQNVQKFNYKIPASNSIPYSRRTRRYVCDKCIFVADTVVAYQKHLVLNHGEVTKVKLYPCDRCSVSFTQPISLKRHVNREHGVKKERMIKAETDPRSEQEIKEEDARLLGVPLPEFLADRQQLPSCIHVLRRWTWIAKHCNVVGEKYEEFLSCPQKSMGSNHIACQNNTACLPSHRQAGTGVCLIRELMNRWNEAGYANNDLVCEMTIRSRVSKLIKAYGRVNAKRSYTVKRRKAFERFMAENSSLFRIQKGNDEAEFLDVDKTTIKKEVILEENDPLENSQMDSELKEHITDGSELVKEKVKAEEITFKEEPCDENNGILTDIDIDEDMTLKTESSDIQEFI